MFNVPKGTKDCLPEQSGKWQFIESKIREITKAYNVKEIRTPVFEHTEVFLRGVGETTDVVNKEMYTFNDKGGRSITLKPEGTAGVARSFVENGMASKTFPVKLYYVTPCYRYERAQLGRLREFHQFGVEVFGADGADTDAEVILLARSFLNSVGIKNLKLFINSIGCKECRKKFNDSFKEYLKPRLNEMCHTCQERYEKNPMRIIDCKEENCKNIVKGAPKILDYLCDDCKQHFEQLKELLSLAGVEYEINPDIVRGLDYYTKTVFEFVSSDIGAQGTVCGGGRYDGLIAEMGGGNVSGVGFGLGIERLLLVMESAGADFGKDNVPDLFIVTIGDEAKKAGFKLCQELREDNISAEIDHLNRSVKAQFKYADKIGAKKVIVIGEDELKSGEVSLKSMNTGSEEKVKLSALNGLLK